MDELARAADELIPRLRRWTPDSWRLPADPAGPAIGTRAEAADEAAQRLADLVADVEGRPRRTVPRRDDVNPADRLAVMVDDVGRTGDPAAAAAATGVLAALRAALGFRT
jgi:hypothetical protein